MSYKSDAQCNHVNLGVLYNDPLITVSYTRYTLCVHALCHSSTKDARTVWGCTVVHMHEYPAHSPVLVPGIMSMVALCVQR
jgi:hypothetical protein